MSEAGSTCNILPIVDLGWKEPAAMGLLVPSQPTGNLPIGPGMR